jgi:hypothetical protein
VEKAGPLKDFEPFVFGELLGQLVFYEEWGWREVDEKDLRAFLVNECSIPLALWGRLQ